MIVTYLVTHRTTMSPPLRMQHYRPDVAAPSPTTTTQGRAQPTRSESKSPPPQKPPQAVIKQPEPVMAAPRKMENAGGREYKYFTEISQMMFVFGEVQDPMPETVNLVEDIVRSQILELVRGQAVFSSLNDKSECTANADYTSPCARVAQRCPIPVRRRSHIPHPTRQSQGQSFANIPLVEGSAEDRQRLGWRWGCC